MILPRLLPLLFGTVLSFGTSCLAIGIPVASDNLQAPGASSLPVAPAEFGIGTGTARVNDIALIASNVNEQTAVNQKRIVISSDKASAKIDFGSRKLMNNLWGAPPGEELISTIYLNQDNSFGIAWDRQSPKKGDTARAILPIYPSVRVGGSPWETSNCQDFPTKLGDIHSLTLDVDYSYPTVPSGSFDFAYDVFLSDTNKPSASPHPEAEVMIWIQGTAKQPASAYKGDFQDGPNTYSLYSWTMPSGRQYFSFLLKGAAIYQGSHTVDAKGLLDKLSLDPNWYVTGIELGNEVYNGSGKIEISRLSVNLNGHEA
jgi:hypothetical protein